MQRRQRRGLNSNFVSGGFVNNTPTQQDYQGGGQLGSGSQNMQGSSGPNMQGSAGPNMQGSAGPNMQGSAGPNMQGSGGQNMIGSGGQIVFTPPPPLPHARSVTTSQVTDIPHARSMTTPLVTDIPHARSVTTPQLTNLPSVKTVEMSVDPPVSNESYAQSNDESIENGKKNYRKFFGGSNKKPSVRAKERRIRTNRRLRKVLIPKNALMSLHEVKGISLTEFDITSRSEGGFSAKVTVNNMQYEGIGNSKISAKNNACEKALRDHVIFKMLKTPIKLEKTANESADTDVDADVDAEQDVDMKDTDLSGVTEEDEVPMLNLASFALFKLFLEWESEGFDIPEFRQQNTSNGSTPATPPVVIKRSELPPNWETMHPTSLLCMMRPGISYSYLGGEGTTPNTIQKVGVSVDGENFVGEARSRKLARRNAAVDACNQLFNTTFAKSI